MKRKVFLTFTLICVVVTSMAFGAAAAANLEEISAYLNKELKMKLKGKDWQAKDSDGGNLFPITYNDSTYLPIRAISEALGVKVDYDNDTKTVLLGDAAKGETIIEEWNGISVPPAPQLKPIALDPKTTALLVLDIQKNSCTEKQRPRCVESIPKVKGLLDLARNSGMPVVHSLTSSAKPEDIVPELTPKADEPIVKSSVDKFFRTDLEKILQDKGVKTVVIVGTVAHGAVLHTATGASVRGLKVIVPVDGMSAENPFGELYTAWHMLNSPGTRNNATLTKISLIGVNQ